MTSRRAKELRPLLLPWCVAAAGGLVPPPPAANEGIFVLGSFAFFGGVAALAATSLGTEFQHRTLGLWLSQPCDRSRLWREKLGMAALATATLAAPNWRVHHFLSDLPILVWGLVGLFLLATICSVGFWTLITRSAVRGIWVSVVSQSVVFVGLGFALAKTHGLVEPGLLGVLILVGLLYSATFLWLGRRCWRDAVLRPLTTAALLPAALLAVMLVAVLCWVAQGPAGGLGDASENTTAFCLTAASVVVTICSAGFWTMVGRTTIAGAVLTMAAQFLLLFLVHLVGALIYGDEAWSDTGSMRVAVLVVATMYAFVMLWLGWRKFASLELRDPTLRLDAVEVGTTARARWWSAWLRFRPEGNIRNLARKELRLQKPVFLMGLGFLAFWLLLSLLIWLQPRQGYQNLADVLLCLYLPVATVLTGCLSLGEEKTLGVMAWHLSLPASSRRQWLVKLGLSAGVAAVIGLFLPWAFASIREAWIAEGLATSSSGNREVWAQLALLGALLFVLGFWASTLLANTVRAALTAVLALGALIPCAAMGIWCAQQVGGLETNFAFLTGPLIALRDWLDAADLTVLVFPLGTAGFLLVALHQSLRHFRRTHHSAACFLRSAGFLAFAAFALAFWMTDLVLSARRAFW